MRVAGVWNGGAGRYSSGGIDTDGETWASLSDARRSLVERYESGYWLRDGRARAMELDDDGIFHLGEPTDCLRPCVGEDTSIDLYRMERVGRGKWRLGHEPYARLTLGPRLGVRVENW